MILIGDIGNTDTKICIINSNYKIVKRLLLPTKKINNSLLVKKLNFIIKKNIFIKKSLFCSVVPNQFLFIKSFLQNAPKQIIEKDKKALIDYKFALKKLNSILNSIKN